MKNPLRTTGHWRASIREPDGWSEHRGPAGPYERGSLVEWGSITKGLVGTTAARVLDVDQPVANLLPEHPDATVTIADLLAHTSGLPRLPASMRSTVLGDPYRSTVGRPLAAEDLVPTRPRGAYEYSNLGYALLGTVLDRTRGDWFAAVREQVLEPAGITSATVTPTAPERIVPSMLGRRIPPWRLAGSPYAAAGGVWSTFDDLCRYADWALAADAGPERTTSWQRADGLTWINGEVRAAGAVIAEAHGVRVVVHTLAQTPHTGDRIATALIRDRLRT
jgi:CubicO group peptidase (beta-lactamase class C family)